MSLSTSTPGGSLDKEVCQNEVVAWEDLASVDSIVIEDPPGEKQCGPLIAFGSPEPA